MTTELAKRAVPKDSGTTPPFCHLRTGGDPLKALCGKQLLGIPAPVDREVCVVCDDLWNHGFR